jgi:hypothetical protein
MEMYMGTILALFIKAIQTKLPSTNKKPQQVISKMFNFPL